MRLVSVLLAVLNVITGAIGLAAVGAGLWLWAKGGEETECRKLGQWVAIGGGGAILVIAGVGFWGAWQRLRGILRLYVYALLILALLLAAFTIAAVVMIRAAPHSSSSATPSDYHSWLQRRLVSHRFWNKIKSCLVDVKLCNKVSKLTSATDFDHLPRLQSGCCKPPTACNMTFVNGTTWESGKGSHMDAGNDCTLWVNGKSRLCFDCDSCKLAILHTARHNWKNIAIIGAAIVFYIILVSMLAFCASGCFWCCGYGEDDEEDEEEQGVRYPPAQPGRGFYVNKA